jgi:hypothetical protein
MELKGISFRAIREVLQRVLLFAAYSVACSSLLTLCRLIFFVCYNSYSEYLIDANFFPINGKFQAFNPIRRLLEGQFAGADFVSYTGSGPSLLTLAGMLISDCQSFTCSVFWGNFLSLLLTILFFSWITFLCLSGARVPLARWFLVFLSVVIGLVIGLPLPTHYPQLDRYFASISSLNLIGNSQLGLRVANATICSIFIFIIASCKTTRTRSVLTVPAFCVALTWSNDYGLFSALSVIATYGLVESRLHGFSRATIKHCALTSVSSIAVLSGVIVGLSGGHPLAWISRNVLSVAQDQMWYFLPHAKVLTAHDILLLLPSAQKLYASVAVLMFVVLRRPLMPELYASASLVFITLSSGLVSQIGGHISDHYMIAFERAFWPVMTVWAVSLIRITLVRFMPAWAFGWSFFLIAGLVVGVTAAGVDGQRVSSFEAQMFGKLKVCFLPVRSTVLFVFAVLSTHYVLARYFSQKIANSLVVLVLIGFVGLARRADGSNLFTPERFKRDVQTGPSHCQGRQQVYVAALGGCLVKDRAADLARLVLAANNSADVFSAYSSAFDVMVGAFNPSGSDYIIHALGDVWRARYEATLAERKHEYVTTMREDFTQWESWVRRANWGSYAAILANYRAIAMTDYNVLWRRSGMPERNFPPGGCEIVRESPSSTALKVTPPSELREPGYVDLNIEYTVSHGPWWRAPFTLRPYVIAHDGWADYGGSYGIPSSVGAHAWMIPVEFASKDFARIGNPQRVIFIKSMPADAVIEVTRCFSTFSAPTSRFLANDGVVR